MKHPRWNVTAKTSKVGGVANYMSLRLMRDFEAVLRKHKINGWKIHRKPVNE